MNNILDQVCISPHPVMRDLLLYLLGLFLGYSLLSDAEEKKNKNLEEANMVPKLSEDEKASCGPLCQILATREGDCDKAFVAESTSEVCRHRRTKQLSRNMLTVLRWFTKFPGG